MIENILFVLDTDFHLLDIWVKNSTKGSFKFLELF